MGTIAYNGNLPRYNPLGAATAPFFLLQLRLSPTFATQNIRHAVRRVNSGS